MRLKSNAIWHSLPGVEAVYQPIGAPSAVDALLNVGHDHRMVGKYTATPGVLPTWSAAAGHTYNGTTQYAKTGIIPAAGYTMIVRFSGANPASTFRVLAGSQGADSTRLYLALGNDPRRVYGGGGAVASSGALTSGVLGIAGQLGYLNGVYEATTNAAWSGTSAYDIWLGTNNTANTLNANSSLACSIQSFLIASRTLTAAEVWLCSRQMAYCEQNGAWNAWARRRMYFYAPSAAAIRWPGVGRGGPVGGSPGIRGSQ